MYNQGAPQYGYQVGGYPAGGVGYGAGYGPAAGGMPYAGMPFYMSPPQYAMPMMGGGIGGGGGMQFLPMTTGGGVQFSGKGANLDKLLQVAANGSQWDKGQGKWTYDNRGAELAAQIAEANTMPKTDGWAVTANLLGIGLQGLNMWLTYQAADRMYDLQETYMEKQEGLAEKYMALQETAMNIHKSVLDGNNDLTRDLARIQMEIAKFQISKDAEVKIENTRTLAANGYMNDRFYGRTSRGLY